VGLTVASPAAKPDMAKELPSNYCHACRRWIESQERVNLFASVDGVAAKVGVWTCPAYRGESTPVVEAHAPATQADVARDERLGPHRAVVEVVRYNDSGLTARARLECGHEACVVAGAKVAPKNVWTRARCRRCLKKESP